MADRQSPYFVPVAIVLIVALLFGGSARALNDLVILLAAMPLLFMVLADRTAPRLVWTARMALILVGLSALQLVPLPPAVWTALPGRDLAAAALTVTGQELGWRPIALDPMASFVALVSIVAPLTIHIAVSRLDASAVRRLMAITAAAALLSALIGVVQRLASGLAIYQTEHSGAALGLFANRNHHTDLLLVGMLLLTALIRPERLRSFRIPATAALALLVFAVIATTSRAGIALAVPVSFAALAIIWGIGRRGAVWLGLATLLAGLVILFIPAFAAIFDRFGEAATDQRLTMAKDSLAATRTMWPVGSGWGSFVPVYMAFEDLDMLEARYVVAAHNDYLQLVMEGGVIGLMVAVAGPLALAVVGWQLLGRRAPALVWGAWGAAAILLAHSAFDFPLRTGTLAVLFGFCTAAAQTGAMRLRRRSRDGS